MTLIHDLTLPKNTYDTLMDLTHLQIDLLNYAANEIKAIDKDRCVAYLNKYGNHSLGNNKKIVSAIWESKDTRIALLDNFSKTFPKHNLSQASDNNSLESCKNWLSRIRYEVEELAKPSKPILEIYYFYGEGTRLINSSEAPTWQQKAGDFFLHFYERYLDGDNFFPKGFFPNAIESFGRQIMLKEFQQQNKTLLMCPACDETGYCTQSSGKIYTTLDHYLPKHLYPQFACHPHNLIPTCHACNMSIKGNKDPLVRNPNILGPGQLSRASLPYADHYKRRDSFRLEVKLGKGSQQICIGELRAHNIDDNTTSEQEISMALHALQQIYAIPQRWADTQSEKKNKPNEDNSTQDQWLPAYRISEALFRRMRHFLGQGKYITPTSNMREDVRNSLKLLLYYLDTDDRGRDPFAGAMLWILVALLQEDEALQKQITESQDSVQLGQTKQLQSSFIEEVLSWCGQDTKEATKREMRIKNLLRIYTQGKDNHETNRF